MTLQNSLKETLKPLHQSDERIISFEHDDQKLWLKKIAPRRGILRYWWADAFAALFGVELAKAAPQPGGVVTLASEQHRLKQLYDAGIQVPKIIVENKQWMVIADIKGQSLRDYLDDQNHSYDKHFIRVQQAQQALNKAHHLGQYLGQPFSRNIIVSEEGVGFIDFEDDPLDVMSLEAAQARDGLVFLYSVIPSLLDNEERAENIVNDYIAGESTTVTEKMMQALGRFSWVAKFPYSDRYGKDLRMAIRFFRLIVKMEKNQ